MKNKKILISLFAVLLFSSADAYAESGSDLTELDAYRSVYNYMDRNYDMDVVYASNGYVLLGDPTEDEYVINVRSFTGVCGSFYVEKSTGDVFSQWEIPNTKEWTPLDYVYTIEMEEVQRQRTEKYEYISDDGYYRYIMNSASDGKAVLQNDIFIGYASEYAYDETCFTVYGTVSFTPYPGYHYLKRESILGDGFRAYRYDEDTLFMAAGGDAPPVYYSVKDFCEMAVNMKDNNLALIIEVQDGIAQSIRISS